MSHDLLFIIAYWLGLMFAGCIGYITATVQALNARQKLFDCGIDFLKDVWK